MKKLGRPSKYQRNMCHIAYNLLAKGYSKEAIASTLGVNKDTLYQWVLKHKEFSDTIKRGEAASQMFWEDIGIRGMNGQIKGFNASVWIFNMKNRFAWREKEDIVSNDTRTLNIGLVSYADAGKLQDAQQNNQKSPSHKQ